VLGGHLSRLVASEVASPLLIRQERRLIEISSEAVMRPDPEHASAARGFEARLVSQGARPTVVVRGDIDLTTGPELAAVLDVAMTAGTGIDLDLRHTTFIDSTGILVLVEAHVRLGQVREAIVLHDPSPAVRRVLGYAGVEDLFTLRLTDGDGGAEGSDDP
jgi:anti-sigma B factor antagonist